MHDGAEGRPGVAKRCEGEVVGSRARRRGLGRRVDGGLSGVGMTTPSGARARTDDRRRSVITARDRSDLACCRRQVRACSTALPYVAGIVL